MNLICDLCGAADLEAVYEPASGGRGLKIYLCGYCGLVQSLPRADRAPRRAPAISSGADWGNVRYGKGFRTQACLSLLGAHADLAAPLRVLDAGSNRGSFARAMLAAAPHAALVCVEPDERVASSCAGLERAEIVQARIEDAVFPDASFDVVHSCHTIEHLASPAAVLADHWRALKPGGLLILDAPNIALIGGDDIVEEWFIDKHLYHFSDRTLTRLLEASGFEIVAGPDGSDRENLLVAARKISGPPRVTAEDRVEAARGRALVVSYVVTRARNHAALGSVADELARLAPRRVALWGAGRLFDALVVQGGFQPASLVALIDRHLKAHVAQRHGVALCGPEALSRVAPGIIVVMSRAFAGEITRLAQKAAPNAEIILYADLLSRARLRLAA